jgi:hypothetical protein
LYERRRPLLRALEDGQGLHFPGDSRHDLHRRCAIADDGNALVVKIEALRPARGVKARTCEALQSLDRRQLRSVENPHGADQNIGR